MAIVDIGQDRKWRFPVGLCFGGKLLPVGHYRNDLSRFSLHLLRDGKRVNADPAERTPVTAMKRHRHRRLFKQRFQANELPSSPGN